MSEQTRTIFIVLAVAFGLLVATAGGAVAGGIAGYLIASGQHQARLASLHQHQLLEGRDRNQRAPSHLPQDRDSLRRILRGEGALVLAVVPDSPADVSGIRPGNLITSVDGVRVAGVREAGPHSLTELIRHHSPGHSLVLTLVGPDGERRVGVTLGETEGDSGNQIAWLGIRYRPISAHGIFRVQASRPWAEPQGSTSG
ncbi:MAG: PDZ domain-containing protein [Anaerolineae bacterium]